LEASLKDDQLEISHGDPNDSKDINFSVAVCFSGGEKTTREKCFNIPVDEKTTIRITWTISRLTKPNGERYSKAIDHYSTLPYGWVPDNGIDFFNDFILRLEEKWIKLCDLGENHLTNCVS
jgi:hypothetical protein